MDIRIMNSAEFERSKALWAVCFPEDDTGFIDFYYRMRTCPEFALGAFEEGSSKPVAMMHLIPFDMSLDGKIEPVCLIAGVSTTPELRGRGICTRLFEAAQGLMIQRGYSYSVLSPFKPTFYARLGYSTFITRRILHISYGRTNIFVRPYDDLRRSLPSDPRALSAADLKQLYDSCTQGFNGRLLRSVDYFEAFSEEYSAPEAKLVVTPSGLCAGYTSNGGTVFEVSELYSLSGSFLDLLPCGFDEYLVPLPLSAPVPEIPGAEVQSYLQVVQMIRPVLKPLPDLSKPHYGFDRY